MEREFSELSEFRESDKSLRHELGSIKNPVCHLFFAGAVVIFQSLTLLRGCWLE